VENLHSSIAMELFNKRYFSLNKSLSKNILICLKRTENGFLPRLFLYGGKDSILMSMTQFANLILEEPRIMEFMDGRAAKFDHDLSSAEDELTISGKIGSVRFVVLRQQDKESGRINVLSMAKTTYQRLIDMSSLVQRMMVRFEKAAPVCQEMYVKYKKGDLCHTFYDQISPHGFDFCVFAMELLLFEAGVRDDVCIM
jgi:hypothetical protein